ncbi:MAG: hypothetical protein HZC48_05155 [Nitrospirae bacterium]|nr:hypothetical protein [Nitrospirota bacterium]
MSLFAFPHRDKPQYLFHDRINIVRYFADNFLFSRKAGIQALINIARSALPDSALCLLFKLFLHKKEALPKDLYDAVEYSKEFIKNNKELFIPDSVTDYKITFIIRKTSWQRRNDKFIILLFLNGGKGPFAVVKAGSASHKISIESEFRKTKTVYCKFSKDKLFAIPEPLAFHDFNESVMYFERPVNGMPLNNYLKLITGKKRKMDSYLGILERCENFLIKFNSQEGPLNIQYFKDYFYEPVEYFKKTASGKRYSLKLNNIMNYTDNMLKDKLNAVWMHGDLWGGSILLGEYKICIIDWEFFTERGIPLWDFFSIAFHAGEAFNKDSTDFLNYFSDIQISEKVDKLLLKLADNCKLDKSSISFLFQTYLLYNLKKRDTDTEHYWQECLEYYWNIPDIERNKSNRLL